MTSVRKSLKPWGRSFLPTLARTIFTHVVVINTFMGKALKREGGALTYD
jgi:hypothetical protein